MKIIFTILVQLILIIFIYKFLSETGIFGFIIIFFYFLYVSFKIISYIYNYNFKNKENFNIFVFILYLSIFINIFPLAPSGSFLVLI